MRLADMHIHTTFSPDGKSSMEEQCIKAREIGIPIICFTEGNQRVFARSILAQDKERWSRATTSQPQSPAVRGFFRFGQGTPFQPVSWFQVHLDRKNAGVTRGCAVSERRASL